MTVDLRISYENLFTFNYSPSTRLTLVRPHLLSISNSHPHFIRGHSLLITLLIVNGATSLRGTRFRVVVRCLTARKLGRDRSKKAKEAGEGRGGEGKGFLSPSLLHPPPPPPFFALAPFRARPKLRKSFFLVKNATETLATQAIHSPTLC